MSIFQIINSFTSLKLLAMFQIDSQNLCIHYYLNSTLLLKMLEFWLLVFRI